MVLTATITYVNAAIITLHERIEPPSLDSDYREMVKYNTCSPNSAAAEGPAAKREAWVSTSIIYRCMTRQNI